MTETTATPAQVAADGLRRIIGSVAPFAPTLGHTELLESVHLRCDSGHLIATATDRTVVAEDRVPLLAGHLEPRLLHAYDADRLTRLLADLDALPVTLHATSQTTLTVTVAHDTFRVGTWDDYAASQYPDLRPVLGGDVRFVPPVPEGATRIDRAVLARFAHVDAEGLGWLLDTGPNRPALLRFGNTFRAAVMPANLEGTAR